MNDYRFVTFSRLGHYGRLGNQLFQIAATLGIAVRNRCDAVFPPWSIAEQFACGLPQASVIAPARVRVEETFAYQDIKITEPTDLVGHFQSERYFKHCEAAIRRLFCPAPPLFDHAERQFRRAVGGMPQENTCSIHVRRGDYVGDRCFADLAAGDYYERAFATFPPRTVFLMFSDDIAWCRHRFRGGNLVFMETQPSIIDLIMMSMCANHIIANSTFSWWGAWLNPRPDKTVIAPKSWFGGSLANPAIPYVAGLWPRGYFDTRDLLPAEWTKL